MAYARSKGRDTVLSYMSHILLSREAFRDSVFSRDGHKCVICGLPAADAHHIIERKLWPDGGYYLDNGASVCPDHHIACERTVISVEDIRQYAGITRKVLPPQLYDDQEYDKWGNPILPNGTRLRGELFEDASVQKVLAEGGALNQFVGLVKYPRTYHLPWSDNMTDDDRMMTSLDGLIGQEVVVTEKMDGENSSLYSDHIHARSVTSGNHASRDWLKNFWSNIKYEIPDGWRICGENLWAKHSIGYANLPSYFMGFSVWNERNECLPWDPTVEWFKLLGIEPVPVIYRGMFNIDMIKDLYSDSDWTTKEGYVVRITSGFPYAKFKACVGKYVRRGHVQTVKHWMHGKPMEKNLLK